MSIHYTTDYINGFTVHYSIALQKYNITKDGKPIAQQISKPAMLTLVDFSANI